MEAHQHTRSHPRRYRRLALIAAAAIIVVPGLAVADTALAAAQTPARATTTAALTAVPKYSCSGKIKTRSRTCYLQTQRPSPRSPGYAPLFYPSGSVHLELPLNDRIHVTCYYKQHSAAGFANDGVQDHVNWTQVTGNTTGHIPDPYVNEGGEVPWAFPFYLAPCG